MIIGNARYTNVYTTDHSKEVHNLPLKHGKNAACVPRYVLGDVAYAKSCHE